MDKIIIKMKTRFPIRQTGDRSFEVEIETGPGSSILDPMFCSDFQLSASEVKQAELEVLRSVAIIH